MHKTNAQHSLSRNATAVVSITKENTHACHISNTQRTAAQQSLVTAWFPFFLGNKLFLRTFHLRLIELSVLRFHQDAVVVLFLFVRGNVAASGKGSSSFAVITCVCVLQRGAEIRVFSFVL